MHVIDVNEDMIIVFLINIHTMTHRNRKLIENGRVCTFQYTDVKQYLYICVSSRHLKLIVAAGVGVHNPLNHTSL